MTSLSGALLAGAAIVSTAAAQAPAGFSFEGSFEQGGLVRGTAPPG